MQRRHGDIRPEMEWVEMDILDLRFGDEEFDLVVDKGEFMARCRRKGRY
jgi:ubiquinone/menaquinone biosynthesis C-methylase UbiE